MSTKRIFVKIATLLAVALAGGVASATTFPERPVTLVVPGPPGGSGDIVTRVVGQALSAKWNQPVIVDNRPGAGGVIGIQAVLRAKPDGYTLVMGNTGPNAINYSLVEALPYKAEDLVPIARTLAFPNVLVVKADSSYQSVEDLVSTGKRDPQKLSFSSSGVGQTTHLSGELFKVSTGAGAVHIPYKGANLGLAAVMSGEVDFMFDNLPTAQAQIKAGTVRALAVTSPQRLAEMPDTPTMMEAGVSDYQVLGWFGLFAPAGTPPDVIQVIHADVSEVLQQPEIVERFAQLGGQSGSFSLQEFATFVDEERKKWEKAVTASGAKSQH